MLDADFYRTTIASVLDVATLLDSLIYNEHSTSLTTT